MGKCQLLKMARSRCIAISINLWSKLKLAFDRKMVDVAVDRNVSQEVRDIVFDAIKSIREESKKPDTISIIEHITRNPANFTEVELKDNVSKLFDSGILINKKSKPDLDSLFVNEGASTDNTSQG